MNFKESLWINAESGKVPYKPMWWRSSKVKTPVFLPARYAGVENIFASKGFQWYDGDPIQ